MTQTVTRWTFDSLAEASREQLEQVLLTGAAPDPDALEGWIYCGWNHERVARLSGEKFKKGFRRRDGRPFGYNEVVVQDRQGHRGEWQAKMKDGRPRQLGYFRVGLTADEPEHSLNRPYRHTGHFNYHVPANTGLNLPLRVIRDFAVLANPGDHELILGKAYLQLGPPWLRVFYSYFLLGHRQKIEHEPW